MTPKYRAEPNRAKARHDIPSPFPFIDNGHVVATDEQCMCLHARSEHNDTLAYGHGDCMTCDCRRFTWRRFVGGN